MEDATEKLSIKEFKGIKSETEKEIKDSLIAFMDKTDISIEDVYIDITPLMGTRPSIRVKIHTTL